MVNILRYYDETRQWSVVAGPTTQTNSSGTNYTYQNSDISTLVIRSNSGTLMVDTMPGTSPGFITANGTINIYNNDATALLVLQAGAGATLQGSIAWNGFIVLAGGQSASFVSDGAGNYWVLAKPDRVSLNSDTTVYVSTTGSDTTGNGLESASEFATMQMAWDVLIAHFDLNGFVITIQLANGTYTSGLSASSPIVGALGVGSTIIQGSTTPANVVVSVTGNDCFLAQNAAAFTIQGMTLSGTANGLIAVSGAQIVFSNSSYPVVFGAITGNQIQVATGGTIDAAGNYSITGGASAHMNSSAPGSIIDISEWTVTLTGTPAFGSAFVKTSLLGCVRAASVTFTGSATGVRYNATGNSVITGSGGVTTYFPGNSAGSTATGGQYF